MTVPYRSALKSSLPLVSAFLICQCGPPSPPSCQILPYKSRGDAALLMSEARAAWNDLGKSDSQSARQRYNLAIEKLIDQLRCGRGSHYDKAAAMGTLIDDSHSLGAGVTFKDLDAFVPASSIDVDDVGGRHVDPGIGIPMVGWDAYHSEKMERYPFAPPTGLPLNLTTILDFDQEPPTWRVVYPGKAETLSVNGQAQALAIDWSAPSALYWQMSDLDDLDLAKVILPGRFTKQTDLYAAAPYDPTKIPVIFVHGLYSSPGTYKVMFNELMGEPWFRDNYQAWFFSYPTGTSWVYNAAFFRDHLRRATEMAKEKGGMKTWNEMVLVGHSMGGVLSHASLIDPGHRFYDTRFDAPIDELKVSKETRRAIRWTTLYEPVTEPSRVVFMAAPHRGSPSANRFFSRFISNIIRLPKTMTIDLVDVTMSELGAVVKGGADALPEKTSIGTLAPNFDGYQALNDSPIRSDIEIHSIIGDRGRGDSPESSDGIVPYWSSHFKDSRSELIVPYGHSLTRKPETIAEVKRILQLHLKEL
ncbi:hypothetical protein ACFQY0_01895 [Haloferula chungangensis]|uniref:Alpha/beta hydrolase n=1 Tax=Haloferula chungangensis TaxID=1048331 RepID=A0ABW2L2X4_9BACT